MQDYPPISTFLKQPSLTRPYLLYSFNNITQLQYKIEIYFSHFIMSFNLCGTMSVILFGLFCVLAVNMVLDSLDDIHCLQEPPLDDREFLQAVLEDGQLHALLEVGV